MATDKPIPQETRLHDKVQHLPLFQAATASSSPDISRKQPSLEAIAILARIIANKIKREAKEG